MTRQSTRRIISTFLHASSLSQVSSFHLFGQTHLLVRKSPGLNFFTASSVNSVINIPLKGFAVKGQAMMSKATGTLEIAQFPCLNDNYGFLLHDPDSGETAAVDTPCAKTYKRELEKRGWNLTHIFNTHKHGDHVGGNMELKSDGVKIFGPSSDGFIPGIDVSLSSEDKIPFGGTEATIMDVGGHTLGHIAFHFPREKVAFVGDALFPLGCGRMFEGTPSQFWSSLLRLRSLPDDTVIYSAHEYTEANARFAMSVEPGNADLVKRVETVKEKRSRGEPTVPCLLSEEKSTNPFLRGDISKEIQKNVGAGGDDSGADIFGKVRRGKDNFRG